MKITFVCPADNPSGGMRVIAIYADRLARRGHNVTVILPRPTGPSLRARASALVKRRIWLRNNNGVSYFRDIAVSTRWLRHAGPVTDYDVPDADVVIATWWETAPWVWRLSASKGAKLHFMQDYESWGAPNGEVDHVDAACSLPMPKIVIAQWVADLLRKRWQQHPIALIPNSVETEKFFAPPRGKQIKPTVGLTYTTFRNKGSDICIAAINLARQSLPELGVVAFGQSEPSADMPLPESTEFHFRAPEDRLRDIYAECDAWLFGTRIEGFGLPILEAMACRTPVIGIPAGAAPQLIGQGGGILVSKDNPTEMAKAILSVARMTDTEWRAISDRAHQTATSYSWDHATSAFEEAAKFVVTDPSASAVRP